MPLPREKVAAYHRARRARLKAEKGLQARAPATPKRPPRPPGTIPLGRPLTARERQSDAEFEAIERRGGDPEWDNVQGRWRDARPVKPSLSSARSIVAYRPPALMRASGGTPPGPPVKVSIAEATADLRARLATHARAIEELTRRDRDKENRLAALEAQVAVRPASWAAAVRQAVLALARKPQ